MKLSIIAVILSTLAVASAFTPSASTQRKSVAMNAEQPMSRMAFLSAAAAAIVGTSVLPQAANAGTMAQEYVGTVTEQWETGSPTPAAKVARAARFANARTQMNSNFAPIKRLTLERKSPVTRLDINAPNFEAYKRTFPGLYKEAPK
jgi:hypothetical protein